MSFDINNLSITITQKKINKNKNNKYFQSYNIKIVIYIGIFNKYIDKLIKPNKQIEQKMSFIILKIKCDYL